MEDETYDRGIENDEGSVSASEWVGMRKQRSVDDGQYRARRTDTYSVT